MSVAEPFSERALTRAAIRVGIRDAALLVLGYIPFGLAAGAAMVQTGVSSVLIMLTSPLIFAGASQVVAVQLLGSGAGIALVVFTVLIVNARHLLYSASLQPHWVEWSRGQRLAGAFLLSDPAYALVISRIERPQGAGGKGEQLGYYFGAGITLLIGWTSLTTIGVLLGGLVPDWLPLELAIPLTFLLLLLPLIKDRAGLVAAVVAGLVALVAHPLPFGLGLILGATAGLVAGGVVLARNSKNDAEPGAEPDAGAAHG